MIGSVVVAASGLRHLQEFLHYGDILKNRDIKLDFYWICRFLMKKRAPDKANDIVIQEDKEIDK